MHEISGTCSTHLYIDKPIQNFCRNIRREEYLAVDGRIRKRISGCGMNLSGSGKVTLAGCCEHGYDPSGFHRLQGIY